jgi:uncharacterized protein (TIGR03435 family)
MKWTSSCAGLALLVQPVLLGQTPAPAFEVASVKTNELPPGTFRFATQSSVPAIKISGNRVTTQGSLLGLAAAAYNLRAFQIFGAPRWTDKRGGDQVFDIAAKTEGDGTPSLGQVRQMLRTLLADRFQLKLHRETKELLVYDLVVAKNGPKLRESSGDGSPHRLPHFPVRWSDSDSQIDR